MMSETIDETLDKDNAEEETEELTNQVSTSNHINFYFLYIFEFKREMKGTFNHGLQNRLSQTGIGRVGPVQPSFCLNRTDSHDLGTVVSQMDQFCPLFSWLFCVGKIDATQEKKLMCYKILNRNGVHVVYCCVGNMTLFVVDHVLPNTCYELGRPPQIFFVISNNKLLK